MANRSRSRAHDDDKPVSLTSADFDNNPAVVNMAAIVDGDGGETDPAETAAVVAGIGNDANEANARRILDAERSAPGAGVDTGDDEFDEDDPLAGAPANTPGPAIEPAPADDEPEPKAKAKSGAKRTGSVMVTLGDRTKVGGRAPVGVTIIVPAAGDDTDEAHDGLITAGTTVQLARGRATRVSARAADWLSGHRLFSITEVSVKS